MSKTFAIWLCALVLGACPSFAGIGKGNWEVGFDLGGARLDSKVSEDNGYYFGIRGGYFLSDLLQLEGQVSNASNLGEDAEDSLTGFYLNLVANFRAAKTIVPYFLVGIGSTTVDHQTDVGSYKVIIEDDGTGYQAAAGARFFLKPEGRLAIRVELSGQSEDAFEERTIHGVVSAGLTWRLGKAR